MIGGTPETSEERLARILARPFDRRTFLATADKDELVATFDPGIEGVRFVRVETTESPSDVALA